MLEDGGVDELSVYEAVGGHVELSEDGQQRSGVRHLHLRLLPLLLLPSLKEAHPHPSLRSASSSGHIYSSLNITTSLLYLVIYDVYNAGV